ncbi:MAG TPA: DUF1667 domain-containing protein [Tepiditoga sp.]|nr:DUF1667 domain-containing protein [Thermotogota bacterium]HOO75517.1 DUF1667 domain-containing protein [Tepiditoga sp.]
MSLNEEKITCLNCPAGCRITVISDGEKIISFKGNNCPKGEKFVNDEMINPKRYILTSVYVNNGTMPLVSVKSTDTIPKDKIISLMEEIKKIKINAPVKVGDIIKENIYENINLVATRSIGLKGE